MDLSYVMDSLEGVPEAVAELYTEKDGKFVLSGVKGIKTPEDVDRLQRSLQAERSDHKKTKDALGKFGDLDPEDVFAKLDRIEELEAAASGKLDDDKIAEMADKRAAAKVAPIARERDRAQKQLAEANEQLAQLQAAQKRRQVTDALRKAATERKVQQSAIDDVLLLGASVFDLTEDGGLLTRENDYGVPAGMDPLGFLDAMQEKRPHWWPANQGGGATGGNGAPAGRNPWSKDHWNMTEQGAYLRKNGVERAKAMAEAAGTVLGGKRPG